MTLVPKGFWSYARGDDAHLDGVLSDLRRRLQAEIAVLLGHRIDIFQDISELRVGDLWAEKLRNEVSEATFLIPVLTPTYFNRPWCREETMTFLDLASANGIKPLIFPILFVEYDNDPNCEVKTAVEQYQYGDFSKWRFLSNAAEKSRTENKFAREVKEALKQVRPNKKSQRIAAAKTDAQATFHTPSVSPPQSRVKTYFVGQERDDGTFTSISSALDVAEQGSRIVIASGVYREKISLNKNLEIIGEGDPGSVVIEMKTGVALAVTAQFGLVRNISFSIFGTAPRKGDRCISCMACRVFEGRMTFADCVFSSNGCAALGIEGSNSSPVFQRCRFENSFESGVSVIAGATPEFYDCQIQDNRNVGTQVKSKSKALFRSCAFSGNRFDGAFILEGSEARFEDCEFYRNGEAGISVKSDGNAIVHRCGLSDNVEAGFQTEDRSGKGEVVDSNFRGNGLGAFKLVGLFKSNVYRRGNTEE